MKKPCSPHRLSSPFANNIPYTVGFHDFLKEQRMSATSKTGMLKTEPKRSMPKVLDIGKNAYCKEKPVSGLSGSPSKPPLSDDSWIATVRHIVREEIEFSRTRSGRDKAVTPVGFDNQHKIKELADIRAEIRSVSKRLETEKQDRVKIIEGLWMCFNQKIEDTSKSLQSSFSSTSKQQQSSIKCIAESIASTVSLEIKKLQDQIGKDRQEFQQKLRSEVAATKQQRNSQLQVVITSIEHLNGRVDGVSGEVGKWGAERVGWDERVREVAEEMRDLKEKINRKEQQSQLLQRNVQELRATVEKNLLSTNEEIEKANRLTNQLKQYAVTHSESLEKQLEQLKCQNSEQAKHMKGMLQDWQTDKLNIKSRLKKLQNSFKDNHDSLLRLQDTMGQKLQTMTISYNQNFKYFQTCQQDLCQTVKQSLSLLNTLQHKLTQMRVTTAETLITSFMDLASHASKTSSSHSHSDNSQARLQKQLKSLRESMTQFQAESKKHIEKVKDFSKERKLRFCAKSQEDIGGCSSFESIGEDVKLRTVETVETLETVDSAGMHIE